MLEEVLARLQVLDESVDQVQASVETLDSHVQELETEIRNLIREAQAGPLIPPSTSEEESSG